MPIIDKDEDIKRILEESKTVAVVGISPKPEKPSYFVSEVVKRYGFKMYFINPIYAGQEILGEKVLSSFEEIPEEIDIVDVFRNPSAIPEIAKEAKKKGFKTFWFQPGTVNEEVVKELSEEGYNVVVDRCMKIECIRLLEGKK
ncbi:MAG: CoA-binding protein [Aquificae bacterium]|nr:CoA-binding protein [Aquificota bacterium]